MHYYLEENMLKTVAVMSTNSNSGAKTQVIFVISYVDDVLYIFWKQGTESAPSVILETDQGIGDDSALEFQPSVLSGGSYLSEDEYRLRSKACTAAQLKM